MAVAATEQETIIERANRDQRVRCWLALAGDLENFTAEVLSCKVEEVLLREYQNICKLTSQSDYESAVQDLFCKDRDGSNYNSLVQRLRWSNFSKVQQNAIEFAKLFYRYDIDYCDSFSMLDVTVSLHIMTNCTLFRRIVTKNEKLISEARKSRNSVFHNNKKQVENDDFAQAIECAEKLLNIKTIRDAWLVKNPNANQYSIDKRLNTIKNMPNHMSFISEHARKALFNQVTELQHDCEGLSNQVIELKDECESINTLSDKLVEGFQEVTNLCLLQARMPISVSWESDFASSPTFREQQQYKLNQMKSFIASLKLIQIRNKIMPQRTENLCQQLEDIKEELKSCIGSEYKKLQEELAAVKLQMNEMRINQSNQDKISTDLTKKVDNHDRQILELKSVRIPAAEVNMREITRQQQQHEGRLKTLEIDFVVMTKLQETTIRVSELHTEQIKLLQQLQLHGSNATLSTDRSLNGKLNDLNVQIELTLLLFVGCK